MTERVTNTRWQGKSAELKPALIQPWPGPPPSATEIVQGPLSPVCGRNPGPRRASLRVPDSYFADLSKSPLRHTGRRIPRDDFTRRNRGAPRPSHSSARTFRAQNLQSIHEESPSPSQRHPRTSHNSYRSFGLDEDTYYDGLGPSDEEDEEPLYEDSFFHWEEESTLFSDLMEEA